MMINNVDDDGNALELGSEFPLEENEHFNKLPVNTLQSDIQVPTNVYNKGGTQTHTQTHTHTDQLHGLDTQTENKMYKNLGPLLSLTPSPPLFVLHPPPHLVSVCRSRHSEWSVHVRGPERHLHR